MFNQEVCFERLLFCTKLHKVTLVKYGRAIESEWGRMEVRETTSVQEHVVLANIKAMDHCVCGMHVYSRYHTHTHAYNHAYKLL